MVNEDQEPVLNNDDWLQVAGEKKAGVQMLTRVPSDINGMAAAYFKYAPPGQDGPVAANEFVASRLGRLLNLPTAKVQFKEFDGKSGILSFHVATEAVPWNQVPQLIKTDLPLYLNDYDLLAHVTVFDVLINNIDRHGDNLMASRLAGRKVKYLFHLIDHGHTLLGPTANPTPNVFSFPQHIMLPELQALKRHGIEFFEDALRAAQNIEEAAVVAIVDAVPDTYITSQQRQQMKELILQRQQTLYNEFKRYVQT